MLTTCELRWFHRGKLPAEIKSWFAADVLAGDFQTSEAREDWYLAISGCEHLSVKLRQQHLEIKWRVIELARLNFPNNLTGTAEKWIKWRCQDPETESVITPDMVKKGQWVSVKKVRSQIRYRVASDRSLTPVSDTDSLNDGCNVELSQLTVKDDIWWSLCWEASGQKDDAIDRLQLLAKSVLQTYPNLDLKIENSCGYPKWLSVFVR